MNEQKIQIDSFSKDKVDELVLKALIQRMKPKKKKLKRATGEEYAEYFLGLMEYANCEVIIDTDGNIIITKWGHVNTLIGEYMNIYNKTEDEVWELIPLDDTPINWLVKHLKYISVWPNMYIYSEVNEKQRKTLDALINVNAIKENYKKFEV